VMSSHNPHGPGGGDVTYPHREPFDPVHDRIPYSPIMDREPIQWPGGARLAVWVVPNVEHYEYLPPRGTVDPYPRTPHPDVRKYAYHDYGNRVALWRMFEAMDRFEIPATASLNAAVLEHYPAIAQAMADRHWDLMCHGMYNTRFVTGVPPDQERQLIAAWNEVLVRRTGRRFDGLLGPFITATGATADLLADAGMRYHADWVHDERPSPLVAGSGAPIVALPYTYELNDGPLFRAHVEGPEYAARVLAAVDRLLTEPSSTGRLLCVAIHPFVMGQPHRILYLEQILERLAGDDGIWLATAGQIVDHYVEHYHAGDLEAAKGAGRG
jgi:allantoinase